MKKTILALGLMVTLASCSSAASEAEAPKADSTAVVAVDTAASCVADSASCVGTVTVTK